MAAWYVVTKRGVVRLLATIFAVAAVVAVAFATLLRNHSFGDIVLAVVLVVAFGVRWHAERCAAIRRRSPTSRRAARRSAPRSTRC